MRCDSLWLAGVNCVAAHSLVQVPPGGGLPRAVGEVASALPYGTMQQGAYAACIVDSRRLRAHLPAVRPAEPACPATTRRPTTSAPALACLSRPTLQAATRTGWWQDHVE